jgi:hypothetical protein
VLCYSRPGGWLVRHSGTGEIRLRTAERDAALRLRELLNQDAATANARRGVPFDTERIPR